MEPSVWRDLISNGWTPAPALWLDGRPSIGEMALVWIVNGDEPFEHGITELAYWDGETWVDIQEKPVAVGSDRVMCWAPTPSIETMHGYRKQLLELAGSIRDRLHTLGL